MQCPFKDEKKNKQAADKPQQDLYESLRMSKRLQKARHEAPPSLPWDDVIALLSTGVQR